MEKVKEGRDKLMGEHSESASKIRELENDLRASKVDIEELVKKSEKLEQVSILPIPSFSRKSNL